MTIAAEEIYLTYKDKVSGYVHNKVENYHDAEDLISQVFLKVYQKLDTFDSNKASLSTWIYTITRNTVTDFFRAHRILIPIEDYMTEEIPAADTNDGALEILADALQNLKERERDLILLHYYKGLTLKEVAVQMQMSYINAKVIHKKALTALRDFYAEQ